MKDLVVKDDNGKSICTIAYNNKTDEVDIVINKPINLKVNGNLGTEVNGEFDLTVRGDAKIDTFLSKLFINSYISKYIKDHPDSIEKRKQIDLHNKNYDEWVELNREKMIEFATQYILKKE